MKHRHEKKQASAIRSGAAEYLMFITATRRNGMEVVYADENVWLSQKMRTLLSAKGDRT